ncbi:hypothetical protein IJ114_03250 [Candidatus Saccharibacteria bacterium]|nr:hypothetical protein [Candidatus Saccharibacteria bacterium]
MLVDSSQLTRCPVLSLHVGQPIAETYEPIIDPNDLKIIAFLVGGGVVGGEIGNILRAESVREYSDIGMIVDSEDVFVSRADVLKIDEIMALEFKLIGLKCVTKKGTKLGKIIGYTVEPTNFEIMQIIVQRPALKAFIDPELVISRNEIVEVDDYKVTVKDEEDKIRKRAMKEDFVPNFVNPFRANGAFSFENERSQAADADAPSASQEAAKED